MITHIFNRDWFQKLAFWIVVIGSGTMIYITYLLLFSGNALHVVQPYKVLHAEVAQGEKMHYEVEYCSKEPQTFIVRRELLNIVTGELWDVPDRVNTIPEECIKEIHSFLTPLRVDLGNYKMIANVTVKINAIKWESYQYETEVFKIVPSQDPAIININ